MLDAGSPWRKAQLRPAGMLVLAHLRKSETFAELAAGFDIGTATARGYVTEMSRRYGCFDHTLVTVRSRDCRRKYACLPDTRKPVW